MHSKIVQLLERKGRDVETVPDDATVCDAVARMNARKIGSVLVRDTFGRPCGIFTERDVLVRVIACGIDPKTTPVREVMTRELVTVAPDTTIGEALAIVNQRKCRHLPVVDGNGVCGLISSGDLVSWLVRNQQQTIDDLNGYIRAS